MTHDIHDILANVAARGFVVIQTTVDDFDALGRSLGTSVAARHGDAMTDRLTPMLATDAPTRSLSAIHGLDAFPFHSDAAHHRVPPRYLLIRLADSANSSTPTLLADVHPSSLSRADTISLSREIWLVRGGFGRTFYSPVLDESRMLLRFDSGCMTQPAGTRLKGARILARLLESSSVEEVGWQRGTTLVLDNWRVLHARPAVERSDSARVLLRKLLA